MACKVNAPPRIAPLPGDARDDARLLLNTSVVVLATFASACAQSPYNTSDTLKRLQTENVATATEKRDRVYHFGSQGNGGSFSKSYQATQIG